MTKKTRSGLGSGMEDMKKGISNLYNDQTNIDKDKPEVQVNTGQPLLVPINSIVKNPDQPRKYFNSVELTKLADSIKDKGIIEPLVVRSMGGEDNYQLIVGHRRLMAAKQAGLKDVPVIISDIPDDSKERLELALIENIMREDLNPIEEAEGFCRLEREIGQTVEKIAQLFGKDRTTIKNTLRLLELPEEIKDDIRDGLLNAGHGRAILSIVNVDDKLKAQNIIKDKKLTVREAENLAKKLNNKNKHKDNKKGDIINEKDNEYYALLCKQISNKIGGLEVNINNIGKKKKVEIYYNSNSDIELIMNILGITV